MFNLFNKNKSPNHLQEFANDFTKEQKAVILASQMIISKVHGKIHFKEEKCIENTAKILNFSLNSPALETAMNSKFAYHIEQLKSLSYSQLEWYAISLYELIMCTGNVDDTKISYMVNLLEKVGINENKLAAIIDKYQQLMKQYYPR